MVDRFCPTTAVDVADAGAVVLFVVVVFGVVVVVVVVVVVLVAGAEPARRA